MDYIVHGIAKELNRTYQLKTDSALHFDNLCSQVIILVFQP